MSIEEAGIKVWRGTGRVAGLVLVILTAAIIYPTTGHTDSGFLIPGTAFSHLEIAVGAWCRYIVIEEAMEQRDSSELFIAIPPDGEKVRARHFWLELSGAPLGSSDEERFIVKLLVSDEIRLPQREDSLGDYVAVMYVKDGGGPVQEGDREALAHLEKEIGGSENRWTRAGEEVVESIAGVFTCSREERVVKYEKKIPASGTTLVKKVDDRHQVWFSKAVPLFHMVKYSASRLRDTRMEPPVEGVPVSGKRASKTTVELVDFGSGAKTLLPHHN